MVASATILIPTFNSFDTLAYALDSALKQTVENLEVFVIGDGAPAETKALLERINDKRVRFFDNLKGPRQGELHRHKALQEASGKIVCYLSDDDLFLPDHVENMLAILEHADFAASLTLYIDPLGEMQVQSHDLSRLDNQRLILNSHNLIPLSCAAHTLDLYRRLPYGWRITPQSIPTDHFMWRQILDTEKVVARSSFKASSINFPTPLRKGWTRAERVAELSDWSKQLQVPSFLDSFADRVSDAVVKSAAGDHALLHLEILGQRSRSEALEGRVKELEKYLSDISEFLSQS